MAKNDLAVSNSRVLSGTKKEQDKYIKLLGKAKQSLYDLVSALREIQSEGLHLTVAGYPDWSSWLQKECPIAPQMAQLYLDTVETFGDVTAVDLVRTHRPIVEKIIKDEDNSISEITKTKDGKFLIQFMDSSRNPVLFENYVNAVIDQRLESLKPVEKTPIQKVRDNFNSIKRALSEVDALIQSNYQEIVNSYNYVGENLAEANDMILDIYESLKGFEFQTIRFLPNAFPNVLEKEVSGFAKSVDVSESKDANLTEHELRQIGVSIDDEDVEDENDSVGFYPATEMIGDVSEFVENLENAGDDVVSEPVKKRGRRKKVEE